MIPPDSEGRGRTSKWLGENEFMDCWLLPNPFPALFMEYSRKGVESAVNGLKPAVNGLVAAALLLMNERNFIDYKSWLIFGGVFAASFRKVNPVLLIVVSGLLGYVVYGQ